MRYGYGWRPYVSVAERRRKAAKKMEKLKKKGQKISPVEIEGRKIAKTFWGKAWCDHLESYSDYSNRLPRGRTYVRNGSVLDLQIYKGQIKAMVNGSNIYNITINIEKLPTKTWDEVVRQCTGQINSLVELLEGKFSQGVMEVVTDRQKGLFPAPNKISLSCSCPDWATMCKHVAATLYGVGARLDHEPELLFVLRQVDSNDLISKVSAQALDSAKTSQVDFSSDELGAIFDIELEEDQPAKKSNKPIKKAKHKTTSSKAKTKPKAKAKPNKTKVTKSKSPTKKKKATSKTIKKKVTGKALKKTSKKPSVKKKVVKKKSVKKKSAVKKAKPGVKKVLKKKTKAY